MLGTADGEAAAGETAETPGSGGRAVRRGGRVGVVPAVALAAGASAPLLVEGLSHRGSLASLASVPPLVVGCVALAIAWRRFGEFRRGGGVGFRRLAWGGAVVLTAGAVLFRSPAVATAGFLVTLIAAIDATSGSAVRRAVFPAWLCVWFAVPFAFGGEFLFDLAQAGAVEQGSVTLDLLDVRHRVAGTSIEVPGRTFPTPRFDLAIGSSLAVTCLMAVALRRGAVWTAVLLAATPLWTFCFQVLAVAVPVYLGVRGGAADAWQASSWWLPWAGVGFAAALTWSVDRGLSWLMPYGGERTWWMVRGFLSGDSAVEDRGAPEGIGRAGVVVLTVAFAGAATMWLLPPLRPGSNGTTEEGRAGAEVRVDALGRE